MHTLILALIIHLIAVAPWILTSLKKDQHSRKLILLFALYYLLYTALLALPNWYPGLKIIDGSWNWTGKIFAITGSALFYTQNSALFAQRHYVTLKQHDNSFKRVTLALLALFVAAAAWAFFTVGKSSEKLEYLLFQFTMPGVDEELAFRGIMLGLLSNALQPKMQLGALRLGNPAILITCMLFGLGHSLQIDGNWAIHQNWFEFINASLIGWLLAWTTVRSGSILAPILLHNLINTLPALIFSPPQ